jgi:predicted transposase YbfD/YdcC
MLTNEFHECFADIKDPRVNRTKRHSLMDIIAIAVLGVMAGAQSFDEMEDFAKVHQSWLKQYLLLSSGIPSHDTINRVLQVLKPEILQERCLKFITTIKKLCPETVIPIDGKTVKGSHQSSKGLKGLHIISAWSLANGISLGQRKVDGKSNEIKAIPELIENIVVKGAIVTIDAMGCQKDLAELIIRQEGDYVFGLKGNQGTLRDSAENALSSNNKAHTYYTAKDEIACEHGRIEERHITVLDSKVVRNSVDLAQWQGLKSIVKMTCSREESGKQTVQELFYVSSLAPENPEKILHAIRAHWSIESMHWSLDVTFKEDSCRVRNETAVLNLAWIRKFSLSLLRGEKSMKISIRRKQMRLWADLDCLFKVFLQI